MFRNILICRSKSAAGSTLSSLCLVIGIVLSSYGCRQISQTNITSPTPVVTPSSTRNQELDTIDIAMIPWQVSSDQEQKLQPLADYLTKTLNQPVKFQITKDYETSVDLLVNGKVELAYLGALTYIQAKDRAPNVQPIVAPIDRLTGRPWYTSVIIVRRDSGIKTLADLKGKRFAFVSPSSTSGYLVPKVHFIEIGIDPEKDFGEVKFAGSHDKAKQDLIEEKVDAIADDKRSFIAEQKAGNMKESDYQIIWESDPIPNLPIVASSQVSDQLIMELKKAFVNVPSGMIDPTGSEGVGYTLVSDEDYQPVRKLREQLNNSDNIEK